MVAEQIGVGVHIYVLTLNAVTSMHAHVVKAGLFSFVGFLNVCIYRPPVVN